MPDTARPIAHGLIGPDLDIVDLDDAYVTLLGVARDATIGRPAIDVLHADERSAGAVFLRRALDTGRPLSATHRHLRSDGSAVWVDIHASRIGGAGARQLVVTCRPLPVDGAQRSTVEAQWQMARLLIQALDGGKRAFGDTMIGNPATEILLLAYVAEAEARMVEAGEIATRIGVSWPLTHRWLLAMIGAGFVETERAGPIDHASPVRLTPRALAMIEAIFGALVAVVHGSRVDA